MLLEIDDKLYLDYAKDSDLDDCLDIIEEVSEGLLSYALGFINVKNALLTLFSSEDSVFNLNNIIVLKSTESSGVKALLFAYKQEHKDLPLFLKHFISKDKVQTLHNVLSNVEVGSFYINTLYVSKDFRSSGIADLLIDLAKTIATNLSSTKIYLHCYNDNQRALAFYKRQGFINTKTIMYKGSLLKRHTNGGSILCLNLDKVLDN